VSRYTWDLEKARVNLAKHGVSFEEAEHVIEDPLSSKARDIGHYDREERMHIVGWSKRDQLLVVIVSATGPRPRIISARRATKRERHAYETRP